MKTDYELSFAVKKALAKDMELSALDIRVNTLNGVVHLDGVVDVLGDREYAEKVVRELDGVQDVINRLSIGMERQVKDDEVAHSVEDALIKRNAEYRRIGVATKKGNVHLYGEVDNLAQEKDILMAAMDIQGVREVISHLKLRGDKDGLPIDDVTVHNNVMYMLSTHSDVDRSPIEISVKNGKVTLRGSVDSVEDKQIAGKIAAMAEGVRDVINELHSLAGGTGGDEALAATIRRELGKNPRVSPQHVKVYVEDGMIFLDGQVDSPDGRTAAINVVNNIVKQVEGVKGIHVGISISGRKGSIQHGHELEKIH